MDSDSETFSAWKRRTSPQSTSTTAWRIVVVVVSLGVAVLAASGHLGWAIVAALLAAASVWVSERVARRR